VGRFKRYYYFSSSLFLLDFKSYVYHLLVVVNLSLLVTFVILETVCISFLLGTECRKILEKVGYGVEGSDFIYINSMNYT